MTEGHWVDLGSGGGFPGLVIAILAARGGAGLTVTCVEIDQRKAAFLCHRGPRELGPGTRGACRADRGG